jgi:hypothetical protein
MNMAEWHQSRQGKAKMAQWRASPEGKASLAAAKARYRASDKGKTKERAYKEGDRDKENERARIRAKLPDNLARAAAKARKRRAALIPRAHPSHRAEIDAIYRKAATLGLTVDHVVPLYGENVWGLHAPQNLQIITREENSRKRDRT